MLYALIALRGVADSFTPNIVKRLNTLVSEEVQFLCSIHVVDVWKTQPAQETCANFSP